MVRCSQPTIRSLVILGDRAIPRAQCWPLLFWELALSRACSRLSLGELRVMLLSTHINPISATITTWFMGLLCQDRKGWLSTEWIIYLHAYWTPLHLVTFWWTFTWDPNPTSVEHLERSIHIILPQLSFSPIFPIILFPSLSDLPVNPLATAHESGNNFTSGNFSFPRNYVTMCTTVKISHVGGCLSQLSKGLQYWCCPLLGAAYITCKSISKPGPSLPFLSHLTTEHTPGGSRWMLAAEGILIRAETISIWQLFK